MRFLLIIIASISQAFFNAPSTSNAYKQCPTVALKL
jgi:hypothetical protein